MNSNNFPQPFKAVFKIIGTLLKIIYTGPMGIILLLASGYMAWEQLVQISRFVEYRAFPVHYILGELGLVLFAFATSLLFLRITFNKKLAKISYKSVFTTMAVSVLLAVICGLIDDGYTQSFGYSAYPPYILDWPTQTVSKTSSCDYSQDIIYLAGDFNITGSSFRQKNCMEFRKTDRLSDSYKVEIHYKGKEAELYVDNSGWEMEKNGRYVDRINIWPVDYDYEVPPQDIAYMYKHGVNLKYSEPLVIEKIIIYTAYPEKFDTSEIWFN